MTFSDPLPLAAWKWSTWGQSSKWHAMSKSGMTDDMSRQWSTKEMGDRWHHWPSIPKCPARWASFEGSNSLIISKHLSLVTRVICRKRNHVVHNLYWWCHCSPGGPLKLKVPWERHVMTSQLWIYCKSCNTAYSFVLAAGTLIASTTHWVAINNLLMYYIHPLFCFQEE